MCSACLWTPFWSRPPKLVAPPVRLAATHANHIRSDQGLVASTQMAYRIPQQPSLDGNTVEVEREQSEFSENAMRYQASLRFLDGRIKSLMTAIKGQN